MDAEPLTALELEILREVAGERPARPWGGAVGVALSALSRGGYITRTFGGRPTDKGRVALATAKIVEAAPVGPQRATVDHTMNPDDPARYGLRPAESEHLGTVKL